MQVMEPLVDYDFEQKAIVPVLAESWDNPDPLTWRFHLRRGVKFHDGSDFTSRDVVHSLTRMKTDPISKQGGNLGAIEQIVAVDDSTVDLKSQEPFAPLLFNLLSRVMTSKAAYDQYGTDSDRYLIGTGPYRFKEFIQGQRFVVTRNPDYWGEPAQIDEVLFRAIPEGAARVTALMNNEVDFINNVPPELLDRVTGNARVVGVPSLGNIFLGINPIEEPLKRVEVRRAIYHAIDRKALVDGVLKGEGYVLDGPISPDFFGYDPNLRPTYSYDPDQARRLLAQAGYPNGFKIEQWTSQGRYVKDKEVSEAIAAQLRQVGIDVTLRTAEWGTYFGDYIANGKLPLYTVSRGDQVDPSPYLNQYFRTGQSKRLSGFSDPRVDELLRLETTILDPTQRQATLRQAMSAIMEAAPAVFLYTSKDNYGISNRVTWKPRPDQYVRGQDLRIE
jgi:peptide/nickel transport system substrate-binding protein